MIQDLVNNPLTGVIVTIMLIFIYKERKLRRKAEEENKKNKP
jgi:hypothetical protein